MTDIYYDSRVADYTLRIANAETLKDLHIKHGNLMEAKHMDEIITRLQMERMELMEKEEKDNG